MLKVFGYISNRRILYVRHRGCVLTGELRYRLRLTSTPAQVVQKRLRGFGYAVRRPMVS